MFFGFFFFVFLVILSLGSPFCLAEAQGQNPNFHRLHTEGSTERGTTFNKTLGFRLWTTSERNKKNPLTPK